MTCRGAQSIWDHFKDSHPKNKVTWLYRRLLRLGLHSKFSNVSNKNPSQIQTSGTDDARKRNAECNIEMLEVTGSYRKLQEVTGTITSTATIHRVKSLTYDAHIDLSFKNTDNTKHWSGNSDVKKTNFSFDTHQRFLFNWYMFEPHSLFHTEGTCSKQGWVKGGPRGVPDHINFKALQLFSGLKWK